MNTEDEDPLSANKNTGTGAHRHAKPDLFEHALKWVSDRLVVVTVIAICAACLLWRLCREHPGSGQREYFTKSDVAHISPTPLCDFFANDAPTPAPDTAYRQTSGFMTVTHRLSDGVLVRPYDTCERVAGRTLMIVTPHDYDVGEIIANGLFLYLGLHARVTDTGEDAESHMFAEIVE